MKKKTTYGFGTKLFLIGLFICGLLIGCSFFMAFEETEEIAGTVEHTYYGRYYSTGSRTSRKGAPMCRVVWYDKDGEQVTYGMPNDLGYEVGDTYYLEVDADSNRIPKRSVGEGIVSLVIGLILCTISVISWRLKFKVPKPKREKQLTAIEKKRREVYNERDYVPVVKCSICNGEQVAGFKDKKTGHFTEVMLIQKDRDLEDFKQRYGVTEVKKEY